MKKYAVFSSKVTSDDGDIHLVTAHDLIRLYKVNPNECIVVPYNDTDQKALRGYDQSKLTFLFPSASGNYE